MKSNDVKKEGSASNEDAVLGDSVDAEIKSLINTETSNVVSEDKKTVNKKAVNKKAVNKKVEDKKTVNKKAVNKKAEDKKTVNKKAEDKKTVNKKAVNKKTVNKKAEGAILGRSQISFVDPKKIHIPDDWNPRFDYGNMEELKGSIKEQGVIRSIILLRKGDKLILREGFRRMRAVTELLKEGFKITSVPAEIVKGLSDAQMILKTLGSNIGKPFNPVEEAYAYKKLLDLGMKEDDIAKKVGRSVATINGRLILIDASTVVKSAVNKGQITIGMAKNIVKASKGDLKEQEKLLKEAKNSVSKSEKKAVTKKITDKSRDNGERLSLKRTKELLLKVSSNYTRLIRSRKPINSMNPDWKNLESFLKKLREMKKKGLFS